MLEKESIQLVRESVSALNSLTDDLEKTIIRKMTEKMDEHGVYFRFDQKLLVSAVCSFLRLLNVANRENIKALSAFSGVYQLVHCDGISHISTGTYFLAVIRELLESYDEHIINAWGELYMHVYTEVEKVSEYKVAR